MRFVKNALAQSLKQSLSRRVSLLAGGILVATAVFLAAVPCNADVTAHRKPIVLVLVHPSSSGDDAQLGALIANSFKVELEYEGVRAVPSDASADDDRAIASLAKKCCADFALSGTYTEVGSEVQLDACWIDPAKDAAPARASRRGTLDLSFDRVIASLVDQIVDSQKGGFANLPGEEKMEESVPLPAAAPQPVAVARADAPAEYRPPLAPAVRSAKAEVPVQPFAFSLGSSPFIATFSALNYFPVGMDVSFTAQYRVRAPGGLFGFGLGSGLSGFHGKGAYAEADFYLVPIGIDLLYGTSTGSTIDFFTHVGGGPAVFAVKLPQGQLLAKVIPYATGGIGILVTLFGGLGISLEGDYTCFFDSPTPIMGFAPSLSVLVRL